MSDAEVLIIGAGPSGTCLAAELQRHGVAVHLIDAQPEPRPGTRAIGVHAATLTALAPSGATARLLPHAVRITHGVAWNGTSRLGAVALEHLGGHYPYAISVPQHRTEQVLASLAPAPERGVTALAIDQTAVGSTGLVRVRVRAAAAESVITARAVVVAAGARGRELLGGMMPLRAHEYGDRYLMSDVRVDAAVDTATVDKAASTAHITLHVDGVCESFPLPGGRRRLVVWDRRVDVAGYLGPAHSAPEQTAPEHTAPAHPASLPSAWAHPASAQSPAERLRAAIATRAGKPELAAHLVEASEFRIRRVLATRLRAGRVLAIGDAAHEISPIGGQGMNLGLLDAATLAPVLVRVLRGQATTRTLDEWESARLASARIAARFAAVNTRLGRPAAAAAHAARCRALAAVLHRAPAALPARAFGMGFDRAAR